MNGDGLQERVKTTLKPYTDKLVTELVTYGRTGQPVDLPLPDGLNLAEAVERLIRQEQRALLERLEDYAIANEYDTSAGQRILTQIQIALKQLEEPQA